MMEIREKGEGRYARQHEAISRQSFWGVERAAHEVLTYVEYRAVSGECVREGVGGQYFGRRQTVHELASFYGAGLLECGGGGVDKLIKSGQWHAPPPS
jgi:hypothetical protein